MNARSARNFSIFSARFSLLVLVALTLVALTVTPADAKKKKNKKPTDPIELFNPLLGLDYSHWLVGPIVEIATVEEVETYLALTNDEEASAFVASFWAKRAEGLSFFDKKPQQIFQERSAEADKRFSEGETPGRQTDRGKVWILYGEPSEVEFKEPREVKAPTLEAWTYGENIEEGLDGEKPKTLYRFVDVDGAKVFYTNQKRRPDHFRRLERLRSDRGGG